MKFKDKIIVKKYSFNFIETFKFFTIFIFLTIIGTLAHECGHYVIAEFYNFKPTLHYGSISYGIDYKSKAYSEKKDLICIIAGPLQTILTGLTGFLILIYRKKKTNLNFIDWIAVFMSFFLLRQVFNIIVSFLKIYLNNNSYLRGDESRISLLLGLHSQTLGFMLGLLGIVICTIVFLFYVPKNKRFNLIIGAFFGSLLGFFIWFYIVGEIILL